MSARYFELDGDGEVPGRYDMAGHLAAAGLVVVAIDHPAVGESDIPDDPWTLRPETVADVGATAVRRVLESQGLTDSVLLGLGHSMGAMLVAYQQARHRPYQGIALLGHSGRGLPDVLGPAELALAGDPARAHGEIVELTRARFGRPLQPGGTTRSTMLVGEDPPAEALAALDRAAAPLLNLCGLTAILPGSHADVLAAIDVPVLLGIAEHDIVGPPDEAPSYLPGSADVELFVLPGAHHNSSIAPNRELLWDRVVDWATKIRAAAPSPR
ncbi:MAG: alpha/beta hydrolase [Frankia sp.]|nr:alpha/beta hydrolase [Frankia sp.]